MKILKKILDYDVFSVSPSLYIEKNTRKGTTFGFANTLLFYLIFLGLGVCFISKLFDKSDIKVVHSIEHGTQYIELNLTSEYMYFAFSLEDPDTYTEFIDESIYYPKVFFKVGTRDEYGNYTWESKEVLVSECRITDFGDKYQGLFNKKPLNHMYCVKDFNQTLKGSYLQDQYSFFLIQIFQCDNSTYNGKCKTEEEINKYLNGTFISIIYESISIDPNNYTSPVTNVLENYYTIIGKQFHKEVHLLFKLLTIATDKGLIFKSYHRENYMDFDSSQDMFSMVPQESLVDVTIKLSSQSEMYTRTYTKIQDVIANLGGAKEIIFAVLEVIVSLPTQTLFEIHVFNHLFRYSYGKSYLTNSSKFCSSEPKDTELTTKSVNNFIKQDKTDKTSSLYSFKISPVPLKKVSPVKETQGDKKNDSIGYNRIKLSKREICCFDLYKESIKNKDIRIFEAGNNLYKNKFDIFYLFRLFTALDSLKKCMFTEEELTNLTKKPMIYYNKGKVVVESDNSSCNISNKRFSNIGMIKRSFS